jgi:hypothetical protein
VKEWKEDFYWNDGRPWEASLIIYHSYVTLRQKSKNLEILPSIALGGGLGLTKQSWLTAMSINSYHAGTTSYDFLDSKEHTISTYHEG